MKLRNLLLLSGVGLLAFGSQVSVEATENTENHETGIIVNILERDLSIRHVQPPSFGKQTLTGEKQVLQSNRDLVVRIKDKRMSTDEWKLRYTFQPSEVAEEHQENLVFKIGEGTLSEVINQEGKESFVAKPDEVYTANAIRRNHLGDATSNLLTVHVGDAEKITMYEYRVPKEEITMEIPAGIAPGEYHGTQVLRLINAPS